MTVWHTFRSTPVEARIAYNADTVQPVTMDWDHVSAGCSYEQASEKFARLRNLPNVLLVIKEQSALDIHYTFFVTGFTAQQAAEGAVRYWINEQMELQGEHLKS